MVDSINVDIIGFSQSITIPNVGVGHTAFFPIHNFSPFLIKERRFKY